MSTRKTGTTAELYIKVVGLLVSALVGYFMFSAAYHFSSYGWRSLGAVQGWSGEEGALTVAEEVRRSSGGRMVRECKGTFAPADGGPVRTDVAVHISGGDCEVGRTEKARFVSGSESWLGSQGDSAYGRSGSGVGGLIAAFVLGGVFPGLVGSLCAVFAWAFGRELLRDLRR